MDFFIVSSCFRKVSHPLITFLFAAINLLQQLLTFDPCDRVTAPDALMHRYLSPYHSPSDEPTCFLPFHVEDELEDDITLTSCQVCL